MRQVRLGNTGIRVSRLGFGTGTVHPSGPSAQAMMPPASLARLLLHAFDKWGVNFWDTALAYGTHPHIREALRHVRREEVVIATKLVSSGRKETVKLIKASLAETGARYLDVCLLHGVRTARELESRRGALEAMCEGRERGEVRSVGLSSHGLGALEAAGRLREIELVWARFNFAGLCMDTRRLGLYDRMASIPWMKAGVKALVPKGIRTLLRPSPVRERADESGRSRVQRTLVGLRRAGVGIVGMKILAEGELARVAPKAVEYALGRPFLDAFIIGMRNVAEVDENCGVTTNLLACR